MAWTGSSSLAPHFVLGIPAMSEPPSSAIPLHLFYALEPAGYELDPLQTGSQNKPELPLVVAIGYYCEPSIHEGTDSDTIQLESWACRRNSGARRPIKLESRTRCWKCGAGLIPWIIKRGQMNVSKRGSKLSETGAVGYGKG